MGRTEKNSVPAAIQLTLKTTLFSLPFVCLPAVLLRLCELSLCTGDPFFKRQRGSEHLMFSFLILGV
jgi:hypothetical protein